MRLALLCNPENRRADYFIRAHESLLGCAPHVISWEDYLAGIERPSDLPLRIESPGENPVVREALIRLGGELRGVSDLQISSAHGVIEHEALFFEGFKSSLERLESLVECFVNTPGSIIAMTDKMRAHAVLEAAGLPHVPLLSTVSTWEELSALLHEHGRVFVKPQFGSSASGVIALRARSKRFEATTSIELTEKHLFNSLKVRTYTDEREIGAIINRLGDPHDGVGKLLVEFWIPKDVFAGRGWDLRVLAITERPPGHVVVRTSTNPMTNLHLGNQRGDLAFVQSRLGPQRWAQTMDFARQAVKAFEASYTGLDIAWDAGLRRPLIIEANAFGDLLPGILNDQGQDTYHATLESFTKVGAQAHHGVTR